jgi:hypothetical protein
MLTSAAESSASRIWYARVSVVIAVPNSLLAVGCTAENLHF